jgi:hypothetical protein
MFLKGKAGKAKTRDEADVKPKAKSSKVHVEQLYAVFDNFRRNMANVAYATDPFLLERKNHELKKKLKADLAALGFGEDVLDFSFIPMPATVYSGHTKATLTESPHPSAKDKAKGKKKVIVEDDDEDDED